MSLLSEVRTLRWADWIRPILAAGISGGSSVFVSNPIADIIGAQHYSPRQLALQALALALTAMGGVLMKSPLPQRAVGIALLPGVHTQGEVDTILKATAPGTVPTPEVAAAILNHKPPP
jgi:hypothetical protein